jgi:hypothetical protein
MPDQRLMLGCDRKDLIIGKCENWVNNKLWLQVNMK